MPSSWMAAPTSTISKNGCRSTSGDRRHAELPITSEQQAVMFELALICPEDRVEEISEALELMDSLSVSVEDADSSTDSEQALFGEPGMPPPKAGWQRSRMLALFQTQASAEQALTLISTQP